MDGIEGPLAASLRFKLVVWLSAAIGLVAAAGGLVSFHAALNEAHRQQDIQLQRTGYLISRLDAIPSSPMARERAGDIDFDARVVVRFLQTDTGRAAPPPPRPPVFPHLSSDGLQTVMVGSETWRVFVKTNAKGGRVAVGQQTTVRDAAARASALRTLMPLLLLVPVFVVLVTLLVRQMFKPLSALSDELGVRKETDLGQLDQSGLPSEVWPFVNEINKLFVRTAQSLASQRRFIADAAHELRSPVTALSLQAERLGATEMPGEARVRLGALTAGLGRTLVLLDQLLTLARTNEPSVGSTRQVSFEQVIREVLEDLVVLAEAKNIDVGVVGDVDATVEARLVDLKLLVKNLLDNAIRYTPEGGRVDITVEHREGVVRLQVADTGPGIAPEERERVFDPFYRVLGNGEMGSGLGLAITRTVVANMGATIALDDADSHRGGLRVVVDFPQASSGPRPEARLAASAMARPGTAP